MLDDSANARLVDFGAAREGVPDAADSTTSDGEGPVRVHDFS